MQLIYLCCETRVYIFKAETAIKQLKRIQAYLFEEIDVPKE